MSDSVWLLLDGRAKTGLVDRAAVLDTASSEDEARRVGTEDYSDIDAIWQDPAGELRWDVPPAPIPETRGEE